ncbi:hypothetical protein Tco_1474202 [Tanacetum coccineum]
MNVKGASECMRVSRFMHGITNLDLIKRLNDNIPKSMDEMMSMATTFLRGKVVVVNQSRKKGPPSWRHHEATHKPSFDKMPDFKSRAEDMIDSLPRQNSKRNPCNGHDEIQSTTVDVRPCREPEQKQVLKETTKENTRKLPRREMPPAKRKP